MWPVFFVVGLIVLIVIVIAAIGSNHHEKGDYKDGGGKQIGGNERVPFFIPANDRAGIRGEKYINYHIRPLLRNDEYLLAHVLLPLKEGIPTEIDSLIISRKGLICIESKYWVGHISGTDNDDEWVQEYDDPRMDTRYHKNPVRQNEFHCNVLKRILKYKYDVENFVIFPLFDDGTGIQSQHAMTVKEFKKTYRLAEDNVLTIEQVNEIYEKLKSYVATEEELKEYKASQSKRHNF